VRLACGKETEHYRIVTEGAPFALSRDAGFERIRKNP
jgi:hypothetical protein